MSAKNKRFNDEDEDEGQRSKTKGGTSMEAQVDAIK